MNIKKLNRKGFSHVEMAIVVLVVAALGFVGYRVFSNTSHAGSNCIGTAYLNIGSRGICVTDLQNMLNAINPASKPLAVSGLFDESTQGAVIKFQNLKGLKVSPIGTAESTTWQRLCNTVPDKKTQVAQDAQSDACGKSNFSVVTPKTISSNYQLNSPINILKDLNGNVLLGNSSTGKDCFSTISVINPNNYSLAKVIKVNGYQVGDMTLDSNGNVWTLGYPLCKGGVGGQVISSLLKINVASGKVVYSVGLSNLPNAGKSAFTWGYSLSSDSKGNLYLIAVGTNNEYNLIRLSATDGTLLENYNSFLPIPKSGYYGMDLTIDSKGYLWAAVNTSVATSNDWSKRYTVIDPLKSNGVQVGAVLDTYNNLPTDSYNISTVDYAHNSLYVSGWGPNVIPNQTNQYKINMTTHNIVSVYKNVGGGDSGQSLLDSNKNIWFLNNGSNSRKGSCGDPCTINPNYVPSSVTFLKGSDNIGQVSIFNNSSLGLYTPVGAIQVGNNIWVLNYGPYDAATQNDLTSITIMNVNTQSLVKVLYNHQ